MKTAKRTRLESAGCPVGAIREFLGLNETKHELVEMRVASASGLRTRLGACSTDTNRLGQAPEVESIMRGGMEAGDLTVSLDLPSRAHQTIGAKRAGIGRYLAQGAVAVAERLAAHPRAAVTVGRRSLNHPPLAGCRGWLGSRRQKDAYRDFDSIVSTIHAAGFRVTAPPGPAQRRRSFSSTASASTTVSNSRSIITN